MIQENPLHLPDFRTIQSIIRTMQPWSEIKMEGYSLQEFGNTYFKYHAALMESIGFGGDYQINAECARAMLPYQWERSGRAVFKPTPELCAGLVSTVYKHLTVQDLHMPFECFAIELPNGWAPSAPFVIWVHLVHARFCVSNGEYDSDEIRLEWFAYNSAFHKNISLFIKRDLEDILTAKELERDTLEFTSDEEETSCLVCKVAIGLLIYLSQMDKLPKATRKNYLPKKTVRRAVKDGIVIPDVRIWEVGSEIKLPQEMVRAAGRTDREGFTYKMRFIVRGHWRNQPHGPKSSLRRLQWINPHWKGPDTGIKVQKNYKVDDKST